MRTLRLLCAAFLTTLAAAPTAAAITVSSSTSPWLSAASGQRDKLAREFDARLQYVRADGTLRVMATTTARNASVESFVKSATTTARWYGSLPAFLATVTPGQLTTLLQSSSVRFVEPDYPIAYDLATSAPDVHVRAPATYASVAPPGTQDGTVSLAEPSLTWSGEATSQGFTIANILVDAAGVRPVCAETTCHTFRLHVSDPGDLQLAVEAGTTLVAVEVEKPDGATTYDTGSENPVIAMDNAQPGTYTIRVWLNALGAADPFRATATLSASGSAGSGMWSFDPGVGALGTLRSATPRLDADGASGKGVTVAIIDSGIDRTHPDFGGFDCTAAPLTPCESRIKEAKTIDQVSAVGVDIGDQLPTTELASGHGTHVAGITAGNGYMARQAGAPDGTLPGVTLGSGTPIGVAPQASLVSIKNGDTLWAGLSSFGLDWVLANHERLGIRVINNSWGCVGGCAFDGRSATALLFKALYDAGVLVAFAAGNDGTGSAGMSNAQSPYTLGVANYNAVNHLLSSSSSRGTGMTLPDPATWTPESEPVDGYPRPDIAAPGEGILSTRTLTGGAASLAPRIDTQDAVGGDPTGTGGYTKMSGTSMATPHVVGAAAVLFSACPQARVLDVMRALMASADRARVQKTENTGVAEAFEVGYGGMDVRGALDWLRANVAVCAPGSEPIAAIATPATLQAGAPATFDGTGSHDPDGPIVSYRWAFGDGDTANGGVAQHTYAAPGSYDVTLAVTDEDGRRATVTRTVTVEPEPDPDPATPSLTSGESVAGTGAAAGEWRLYKVRVPAGSQGLDVVLDGPDCARSNCKPNLDLYARAGSAPTTTTFGCKSALAGADERCAVSAPDAGYWYVGVQTVAGKAGAAFTLVATVNGAPPPPNRAPSAGFTPTCSDLACAFADTSADSDGTIVAHAWDFGDGATSSATDPAHTYASAGTYTVALTVTDDDGATETATRQLTVSDPNADPDPSTPTLQDGVAASDQNGPSGSWRYFKIKVPEGRSALKVDLDAPAATCDDPTGIVLSCEPDLDVYVQAGAKPTTTSSACAGATTSSAETCTVASPASGYWYVGVYTYSGGLTEEHEVTFDVTATTS